MIVVFFSLLYSLPSLYLFVFYNSAPSSWSFFLLLLLLFLLRGRKGIAKENKRGLPVDVI